MRNKVLGKLVASAMVVCAAVGVACGGVHPSIVPPLERTHGKGTATIIIKIPSSPKPHRLRPHYISPSTQSVSVTVNGGAPVVANLTPTSPNCIPAHGQTPLTCTVQVPAPPGKDTFVQIMYDRLNATGNQLSTATTQFTIVAGQSNTIPVTLNGIIYSIALVLAYPTPPQGAATTIPLAVTAKDADGNIIVNPGGYYNPITLSDSDSTFTSVAPITVSDPSTAVTVNYNGGPLISATFSASAAGVSPSNVTDAFLTPVPQCSPPPTQTTACEDVPYNTAGQYVQLPPVQGFQASVDLPSNSQSQSKSGAHITVSTALPSGLPAFSQQSPILYFSFTTPVTVTLNDVFSYIVTLPPSIDTSNTQFYIAYYDANNESAGWQTMALMPLSGSTITFSPLFQLNETAFVGQTFGYAIYPLAGATPAPSGTLFATTSNAISEYAAGASGTSASQTTISGSSTTLAAGGPSGFDSVGNIYVGNGTYVTEYSATASGNAPPIRTVGGPHTDLMNAHTAVEDGQGNLFVGNTDVNGNAYITIYAPGASGDAAPFISFYVDHEGYPITQMTTDSSGDLYASDQFLNEYSPVANGTPKPIGNFNIVDPRNGSFGVAVDMSGTVYSCDGDDVEEFTSTSSNPFVVIGGLFSNINCNSIAVDHAGYIYLGGGLVQEFAPGSSGDVPPVRFLRALGNISLLDMSASRLHARTLSTKKAHRRPRFHHV